MSSDDEKNSLSLADAVAMGAVVMIGAGENGTIGSSHLDLPATGIPTLIIDTEES